uniref:Carbohydrate sulfotransferase n=1 Tax=Phallusia mammillata TaxID=59560 RepID=A0A6F9D8R7_9ASCI|nr:carbohydrate sulfotransferase 9-like [Phallusia mammillata]
MVMAAFRKGRFCLLVSLVITAAVLHYRLSIVQHAKIANTKDQNNVVDLSSQLNAPVEMEMELDFMERMKERMASRRRGVKDACRKLGLPTEPLDRIELITSKKYRLAYCPVPKTGCSNMKRVMLGLNGYGNDTEQIFPKNVIGQTNLLHKAISQNLTMRSTGFPPFVVEQQYTTFIVVRHPFERALSAYKNKLTKQWNGEPPQFMKKADYIRLRFGSPERKNATEKSPTFEEFVEYLYDANNTNINGEDSHWNSVNVICFPCQNQYDVIAKIETIEEDLRYLLKLLGAPDSLGMPKGYSKSGKSGTDIQVDPNFKRLNQEQIKMLYQVYQNDFKMFQYET